MCALGNRHQQRAPHRSRSANPCTNFGHFVCAGWKHHHSEQSVRAFYYKNALETLMRAARYLRVPPSHQNAKQQAAALLATCDSVKNGERNEIDIVKRYLAEAGVVWPQRASNPDVLNTILYLDIELNWAAFVRVRERRERGRSVVSITVAQSFHVIRESSSRLSGEGKRSYFDTLYQHYSGRESSDAAFEEILEAEKVTARLSSLLGKAEWEPINEATMFPSVREWREALRMRMPTMLPDVTFDTNRARFFTHFFDIWRQQGERKMHMGVSWNAVQYAALSASRQLLMNNYGKTPEKGFEFRKFCLIMIYQHMGDLVFAGFDQAVFFERARDDVMNLVYAVRRSFTDRLAKRQALAQKLDMTTQWSSVESVFSVLEHHRYFDYNAPAPGFPDMNRTHFVPNWRKVAKAWRSGAFVKGQLTAKDILSYNFFSVDWLNGDFVLSPFALSFPLYDMELTAALKYGGLGSEVALASAVILLDRYMQHGRNDSETGAALRRTVACVERSRRGLPEARHNVLAELASLEALVDAFQAADGSDHRELEGFGDYTATQMFFIAWCFMRCGVEDDPCSLALRNVRRFSQAFHCPRHTLLNPASTCEVL
ncbi:hypothetical protein V5799_030657 [Amblyomma americanum]|uniref:Peptidase M13 N-terminal domain-containing protein n=1 Tax=Amblyomma americanum TaxID=6943 RepID=A0AAQ4ENF6_AMBAM